MKILSNVTGRAYDEDSCVFLKNPVQAAKYMEWGARIIDLFVSNGKFVFVYTRNEHKKFRDKWIQKGTKHESRETV